MAVHDPEDEVTIISADGIGRGVVRGNTIEVVNMKKDDHYEVIVGNIGAVYTGHSEADCMDAYASYVHLSAIGAGRAAGETVTALKNGHVLKEYIGSQERGEP